MQSLSICSVRASSVLIWRITPSAMKKLGLPADSADSFTLLKKADIIDTELEKKLTGMVGFRNVVTHQYREIDYKRVEAIIKKHADDLIKFAAILVALPK